MSIGITVPARINYTGQMSEKPRYHAMDPSRDVHVLDPRTVQIGEAQRTQARLEREGFQPVPHTSAVRNYLDNEELERVYYPEVCRLIMDVTGARTAAVAAAPFVRFGERSRQSGRLRNSRPARFVHIDYGDARGKALAEQVFANESDPARPHHVPHTAFDDPNCPRSAVARSSIEIRIVAYFD